MVENFITCIFLYLLLNVALLDSTSLSKAILNINGILGYVMIIGCAIYFGVFGLSVWIALILIIALTFVYSTCAQILEYNYKEQF